MLLVEARLENNLLDDENHEQRNFFNEYDKSQILNNQITATLNHVPFEFHDFIQIDGDIKPEYFNFF